MGTAEKISLQYIVCSHVLSTHSATDSMQTMGFAKFFILESLVYRLLASPQACRIQQKAFQMRQYAINAACSSRLTQTTRQDWLNNQNMHQARQVSWSSFTTSSLQNKTIPIHNPPSNSALLEITPRAASRLATIAAKENNPRLALRIQVESGGCHGFQYTMSLVTLPEDLIHASDAKGATSDRVVREDDTIFSFLEDSVEWHTYIEGAKIILDGPSLNLLKGSKVDFTQELIGSQFKIINNPIATSSCGCGTSFDIKLD